MKFSTAVLAGVALAFSTSSLPIKRDVPTNLIPEFGLNAGVNPDGTGNCDGIDGPDGKPILIPCACPPGRNTFISELNANVAAGHAVNNPTVQVSFPTDNSQASQEARLNAATVTLQNANGPGQGCPASSTTFSAQLKAIQDGAATPVPASVNNAGAVPANIAALAPPLGATAGKNPDGTGNCDGAVNGANGQPIKVPCACPPAQADYISALSANVAAGHAVNNPSIQVSFPTDNSKASQATRIQAALVTMQNLHGPGVGCPAVSTTLSAQLAAAQS